MRRLVLGALRQPRRGAPGHDRQRDADAETLGGLLLLGGDQQEDRLLHPGIRMANPQRRNAMLSTRSLLSESYYDYMGVHEGTENMKARRARYHPTPLSATVRQPFELSPKFVSRFALKVPAEYAQKAARAYSASVMIPSDVVCTNVPPPGLKT